MEPANLVEVASRLAHKDQLQDVLDYKTEFNLNLFQSPLMLPTGADIVQEFSATVLLALTTQSSSSVFPAITGKLKIHGDHHGESQDTSDLLLETLVEFAHTLVSLDNDLIRL